MVTETEYYKKRDVAYGCKLLKTLRTYRKKNITSKTIQTDLSDLEVDGFVIKSVLKLSYNLKTKREAFNGTGVRWKSVIVHPTTTRKLSCGNKAMRDKQSYIREYTRNNKITKTIPQIKINGIGYDVSCRTIVSVNKKTGTITIANGLRYKRIVVYPTKQMGARSFRTIHTDTNDHII